MIHMFERRAPAQSPEGPPELDRDRAARFTRDLAIQPPLKNVASIKAASDVYVAEPRADDAGADRRPDARLRKL